MSVGAIVLAAGNSTRMGEQKVLLSFNGVTVIEHIVNKLANAALSEIIVVAGKDAKGIRSALHEANAVVVENPDVERGMLSSVRIGIESLGGDVGGCLICLGDQPALQSSVIEAVVAAGAKSQSNIVVPEYRDRRGHPIYISHKYFANIMTSYDETGLRGLLQEFSDMVHGLSVEESWILDDMDYPEDYQRELERLRREF
jgi:molybdenum cofactor cytidylyltransferase